MSKDENKPEGRNTYWSPPLLWHAPRTFPPADPSGADGNEHKKEEASPED
jgi:hypothetical protein